jgi:cysteine desulfurase
MLPYLTNCFGNPSSLHGTGREARRAVEDAREQIARVLMCQPTEILFTSGGTESDNTAVLGIARAQRAAGRGDHIVTSRIEHHAVLHACAQLEEEGFHVSYVPVDEYGRVDPLSIEDCLSNDTVLVSIMAANNEIGTVEPIEEIASICRKRGVPLHSDAIQAFGNLHIDFAKWDVDALSLSAHKCYGPKGVGLLVLRQGLQIRPLLAGGGQEREQRPGTENVAAIVGMAEALRLTHEERTERIAHSRALLKRLEDGITSRIPWAQRNGHPTHRVANIVNYSFPGASNEVLLMRLDMAGLDVSNGAACTSGTVEPSHVLRALGKPDYVAASALRFSIGKDTTTGDIEEALATLERVANAVHTESQHLVPIGH